MPSAWQGRAELSRLAERLEESTQDKRGRPGPRGHVSSAAAPTPVKPVPL